MSQYVFDKAFDAVIYERDGMNFYDFEGCVFNNCDFGACVFLAVTFIDCVFNDCHFSDAKINYAAFRTATFNRCKIENVNFAMCDKLIFEIHFRDCILDFSKFYTLKIKGTTFTDCSIIAVDFMNADLSHAVFDNCDLYRSEFQGAVAEKCDFRTSYNYTIDPARTRLKKALFSLGQVKGLLFRHDITVMD